MTDEKILLKGNHDMKPCPFCGGQDLKLYRYDYDDDGDDGHIECMTCGTEGPQIKIGYQWNDRGIGGFCQFTSYADELRQKIEREYDREIDVTAEVTKDQEYVVKVIIPYRFAELPEIEGLRNVICRELFGEEDG